MSWSNRIAVALLSLLLPAIASAQTDAPPRDWQHYYDRLQEQVGTCGDTEACCLRKAGCLVMMFRTVQEESNNAFEDMALYDPLRNAVAAELTAPHCPPVIRQAARSTLELAGRFSLLTAFKASGEDKVEHIRAFNQALSMLPDDADTRYLQCSIAPDTIAFPSETVGPVEDQLRRIKAALEDDDTILADLYLGALDPQGLTPAHALQWARFRALTDLDLRPQVAVASFENAVALAVQQGERDVAYALQKHTADAHWRTGDNPGAIAALRGWEALFIEDGDLPGQIDAKEVIVLALVATGDPDEAAAELEIVRQMADDLGDVVHIAGVMNTTARFHFDRGDNAAGCHATAALVAYLEAETLRGDAQVAELEARASCVDLFAYERAIAAFERGDAAYEAGDFPGAIAGWRAFMSEAERPRVAEALGADALSQIHGSMAWAYVLTGLGQEAEAAARAGLRLAPQALWIEGNLAHGLLLQGRSEDARSIYLAHVGREVFDGLLWQDVMAKDFEELRAAGQGSPALDAAAAALAAAP